MIHRIVKMHFQPGKIEEFMKIFENSQPLIRQTPGCKDLKLLRDIYNESVYFTLSIWENEQALNDYRKSGFFNETWTKTKKLFAEKAMAWTTQVL